MKYPYVKPHPIPVVCYSSGPELCGVIPWVGWAVALVWQICLTVIGIREV